MIKWEIIHSFISRIIGFQNASDNMMLLTYINITTFINRMMLYYDYQKEKFAN